MLADFVECNDPRVSQSRCGLSLEAESRELLARRGDSGQHLFERHDSTELLVSRLIHHPHSSARQLAVNPVRADLLWGLRG